MKLFRQAFWKQGEICNKGFKYALSLCFIIGLLLVFSGSAIAYLDLPHLPSPETYGDTLMDRTSNEKKMVPVVFSHWAHRTKYTCRVCHYELEFAMKANETGMICEKGEFKGKFCGVCHNGKTAFAPKDEEGDNCKLCHNATASPNRKKFHELQQSLPKGKFGNEIDWAKALDEGIIKPKKSLEENFKDAPLQVDRILRLKAEMSGIPPGVFPHKAHEQWMDCSSCHPEIFNIKKKSTDNLRKVNMLKGESCGICHLKIAFPLNDCKRCHPGMKR